ncbi:MAG: asparagine synthase (glutamine-hydrolyzing) [Chitinophagales bacterium]
MCGISAYISNSNKLRKEDFIKATHTLHHRGPDAEGFFENANQTVFLGHKRLSILDLSPASNQPFFSSCGRYVIVYNGELYNYQEIKQQFQLTTRTTGDTEVILEAFIKMGTAAFELLNGMFAFIIYDIQQQTITVCRDRFGIKPLFYYFNGKELAFSSEIKMLKALPNFDKTIHFEKIPEFLHIGFITEPNTIYKNVFKFPSGTFTQFPISAVQDGFALPIQTYWSLQNTITPKVKTDLSSIKKELKTILTNAVEKQLVSDVPVGTFLSGGIDSSLITAIATTIKTDKIKTFSIGYDNKKYDESSHALAVAEHLNTDHHAFTLTEDDVEAILSDIIFQYDEPFADASAFPTMIVSRLARQHVTVTLSGDGADELFLGYGMYNWAARLDNPIVQTFRKPVYWATQIIENRYKRGGLLLDYPSLQHVHSHIFSQEQYFLSEQDLEHLLLEPAFNFDILNQLMDSKNRKLGAKERQSFWDLKHYLKDDLLVKVDRASMKYSLESRVPFLDNQVVDYALNIDASLRYHNGTAKYVLKEILYELLPKKLFERPKWGFAVPLPNWLKGRFRFLMDKYLNSTIINRYDIVTNLYVQEIKERFLKGEEHLYGRLWTIIILHWWLEENA